MGVRQAKGRVIAAARAGFLLLELVVALAMLAGISLIIITYQTHTTLSHASVTLRLQATSQAAGWLDYYRVHHKVPPAPPANLIVVATTQPFTPHVTVEPALHNAPLYTFPRVEKRELTVTHKGKRIATLWSLEKKV
jgi:hypothetical protein